MTKTQKLAAVILLILNKKGILSDEELERMQEINHQNLSDEETLNKIWEVLD